MPLLASLLLAATSLQGLPPATVASVSAALRQCTGGWFEPQREGFRKQGAVDLLPAVEAARGPAAGLTDDQAGDLYMAAHALLRPAVEPPAWVWDKTSNLTCSARPAEAVQVMEYLVGDGPKTLRGAANAYDWLALAAMHGIGTAADREKGRRLLLKSAVRISAKRTGVPWSDGKDGDLLRNIERAGLRPWLEALAKSGKGSGGARVILADEALPTDPNRARSLLLYPELASLNRLVELEKAGKVPMVRDGSDAGVWSKAWATQPRWSAWAGRLIQSAAWASSGTLTTASERPGTATYRSRLDEERVKEAYGTARPIPMRALVDSAGKALYVEACRSSPGRSRLMSEELSVLMDAGRLFPLERLPRMPVVRQGGKPAFGWVLLPQVHFQRPEPDSPLRIALVEAEAERCQFSAFFGADGEDLTRPIAAPPPASRPSAGS